MTNAVTTRAAPEVGGDAAMARKALLLCGILSSVLYVGTDILAATALYSGYSYTSQQVSELSAVGAPTRPLWIAMASVWTPLVVTFAIGVWLSAAATRSLRVAGILVAVWGIVGLLWVLFAPMQARGTADLSGDAPHIAFAGVQLLVMMLFMAFGAASRGRAFRLYSIATIIVMLIFGALPATQASRIAAGLPTPGWGLIERVAVYAPMQWIVTFAVALLRGERSDRRTSEQL